MSQDAKADEADPAGRSGAGVPAAGAGVPAAGARRGRGARAGLDREQVVAAARDLDPESLTIQAVADRLGVDRKAVNHHVTDRELLLELLAVDAFTTNFGGFHVPAGMSWQDALRGFAVAMRRSLTASGSLVTYFRFDDTTEAVELLVPMEMVLERMRDAGFGEFAAGRALGLVVTLAIGYARDAVMSARTGGHPQLHENRRVLGRPVAAALGVLRRLDEAQFDPFDDRQFDFTLDVTLAGLADLLATGRAGARP